MKHSYWIHILILLTENTWETSQCTRSGFRKSIWSDLLI